MLIQETNLTEKLGRQMPQSDPYQSCSWCLYGEGAFWPPVLLIVCVKIHFELCNDWLRIWILCLCLLWMMLNFIFSPFLLLLLSNDTSWCIPNINALLEITREKNNVTDDTMSEAQVQAQTFLLLFTIFHTIIMKMPQFLSLSTCLPNFITSYKSFFLWVFMGPQLHTKTSTAL